MNDRRGLDDPRTVKRIVYGLATLCVLALSADLFYTKHPHFAVEGWLGFYPVYGFVVSVALVLAAKRLRRVLRRDETYYGDEAPDRPERDRDAD